MLALFGNLSYAEILCILVVAIMVFGRRLPEVAARAAHQVMKLRRSLGTMWRETGLAEEWRQLQHGVDSVRRFDPLQGGPENGRRRLDQQGLPDAWTAPPSPDQAARHAPEVPWDAPASQEPPAAEPIVESGGAEAGSHPSTAERDSEQTADAPRADDSDFGAPPGSVPRS